MLKGKILIVDDQIEMTETLKDILEDEGYQTIVAHNGNQALNIINEDKVKIILMDVKLPDINGVEVFIEIKKIAPDIKVIMMTAFSVENLLRKAMHEGACGVIYKPINIKELIKLVKQIA
jgi:two-component system response regulator (stage 0 sporulation protein F)